MRLLRVTLPLTVCAVSLLVSASFAGLRSPQIGFCEGSLQSYLNGIGESINVLTDQIDAQVWGTGVSGNADFTLMIELAGFADQNAIGIYNADDVNPVLFQVFPGAAGAGWSAYLHFSGGNLMVTLFNNGVPTGSTNYAGVHANKFGFYLEGPGGTFYSQDWRNGGLPQVLSYQGTGVNSGEKWVCFEDLPYAYPDCVSDFEDAVMLVESVNPVPAHTQTWGQLKTLYTR